MKAIYGDIESYYIVKNLMQKPPTDTTDTVDKRLNLLDLSEYGAYIVIPQSS